MTIKELIKKYGEGKGTDTMWKSVDIISDMLDKKLTAEEKADFERYMYALMQGPHYDEHFAKEQVQKMFYTDPKGVKHQAPYWTDEQVKQVYTAYKSGIEPTTSFWDFYVALNMVKSDNCNLFRLWWPDAEETLLTQKVAEATVNWLNDEDNPLGEGRTWKYFNGEK